MMAGTEIEDYSDSPEYQAFVEEQAKYCRCTRGPCDGVLAGGMCDELIDDEDESWNGCFFCSDPDCHNECLDDD